MLRPRSAALVLVVGLAAWLVAAYFTAGPDLLAAQSRLGREFADLGLPGLGALLLSRAAGGYQARADALTSAHASPDTIATARAHGGDCQLALADLFRRRGNLGRARYHLGQAREAGPETATAAVCRLAVLDASTGSVGRARAKRDLLKLFVDDPRSPMPSYCVGTLFAEEGKLKEGVHYLTLSLNAPDGDRFDTQIALARACGALREIPAAVEHANRALAEAGTPSERRVAALQLAGLGAPHPDPWLAAAGTFAQQHRSGLLGLLVLVLALFYPSLLHLVGSRLPLLAAPLYLLARSTEPSAVAAYEAVLRRRPDSSRYLEALARAYRQIGVGTQRAADVHERLWLLRPDDPRATAETVRLTLQSGRTSPAAIQACQAWFDANPEDPQAPAVAAHLARAYRPLGEQAPAAALPALQVSLNAAPHDRDLRLYLGALYSHHGRFDAAVAALEPLVQADPADVEGRQELAHALIGQGQAYQAYRHLRLLPPTGEVATDLYLAGLAADQAGRHHEALRILGEVIRLDPALFDVEERVAAAASKARRDRCGAYALRETVAAYEASLLHRAEHPEHGEVLVLIFRREFSDTLAFPGLFAERLPVLSQVRAGSAPILDYGSEEEAYYVVYRRPDGEPLARLMEARGPLAPPDAAEVMVGVLEALGALHAAGTVHGDLRPSNIWLDAAYRAALIGAGMSLVAEADPGASPPGVRSPFYVAPEVVHGYPFTHLADIYAAGGLLYELLVGSPPLEGPTHLATMMAHVTVEPEPPSMRAPAIPEALDEWVMAALAKDPAYRPGSAREFAEAMQAFAPPPVPEPLPEAAPPEAVAPEPSHVWVPTRLETPPDPHRWWTFYDETVLLATARFAKVYRGLARHTGEYHAVKQFQCPRPAGGPAASPEALRGVEAVRRLFLNELRVLQLLAEAPEPVPGVVRMLQVYRADERNPAYAMALLGETLAQRVERVGPLPEPEALVILQEVAAAVGALHGRGVVHRNLSPTSVLFTREGRVCLAGFDRACALAERGPMLLTEREAQSASHSPVEVIGDPRFLSPEQCQGEEFDQRTDLYSLGCLLHYLLTAAAPFERTDPMQVMLDHLGTPPPPLRHWGVTCAPETQRLLDRTLAKSPAERYASVEAALGREW